MVRRMNESMPQKVTLRDRAGVTRLFDGLELAEPGVVRAAAVAAGLRPRGRQPRGSVGRRGPQKPELKLVS